MDTLFDFDKEIKKAKTKLEKIENSFRDIPPSEFGVYVAEIIEELEKRIMDGVYVYEEEAVELLEEILYRVQERKEINEKKDKIRIEICDLLIKKNQILR